MGRRLQRGHASPDRMARFDRLEVTNLISTTGAVRGYGSCQSRRRVRGIITRRFDTSASLLSSRSVSSTDCRVNVNRRRPVCLASQDGARPVDPRYRVVADVCRWVVCSRCLDHGQRGTFRCASNWPCRAALQQGWAHLGDDWNCSRRACSPRLHRVLGHHVGLRRMTDSNSARRYLKGKHSS